MESFESGTLDSPDFYFTGDDYRYRFESEAKERFLGLLRERFNSGVRHRDRTLKWDMVIEQKTSELCRHLVGRTSTVDFSEPSPSLHREDDRELRKPILDLAQQDARRVGIGRSTFHYLRINARYRNSFKAHGSVREDCR